MKAQSCYNRARFCLALLFAGHGSSAYIVTMPIADLIKIPTVQAFLADGSVMTVFEAILEKFALPKERAEELLDATDAVLDGNLELKDMPALFAQAFGIEEERSRRVTCDVVGFRLLPLEEYVPNVVQQLNDWGADMSKYPKSRVGKLRMSAETLASQLDEKLGLDFSEVLVKRCAFLLSAYWFGEKTKESTLTFFSRATTIGGLGLTPAQSQDLVASIDDQRVMVDLEKMIDGVAPKTVNSGEEAAAEVEKMAEAEEAERAKLAPTPAPQSPTSSSTTIELSPSHEVTSEIPIINKPAPITPVATAITDTQSPKPDTQLPIPDAEAKSAARQLARDVIPVNASMEEITQHVAESVKPIINANRIPQEIFAELVRKALRGVRSLTQTHDVLARDFKLAGADLDAVNVAIEAGYEAMHAAPSISPMNGGENTLDVATKSAPSPKPAPDELLDQRFASITKNASAEHSEEVMPGARVSLSRTAAEERAQQIAAIPQEKLVEAQIASRPAPVAPMLTVGSVSPKQTDRVLTDIQPVRRLVGPIDELGNMTPAEFRRLSTTPADAVQKIEDILSTLERQNYEDRVKGIQAWRQSPMNQLYVAMTNAALMDGGGMAEVAAKRRSAGEESLSPAEIRALSSLNERLRF